ncbi:OmpA family protein [Enterobacteriaceae endosymbiont of Plateumaris rustica]|uniref:OmpA family protein n=1 Tax=Enterobacteriaceae endosymbiont of Plateumaris rustica TaxID=2675796 RepID=UPI001448E66A|nr:OmpA family protein [Enterobacteriaceae endosymbiont of Plateumaris rustica]QJC29041.1 OmpA family protein [Enterobacteriaceae endosymbiont of Plateumaris rustica]
MKKIIFIILTIFVNFCYNTNNVMADTIKNNKNDWYLGSKIGWSQYDNLLGYSIKKGDSSKINKIGSGFFLGYKENRYLNFELGYDWLGLISRNHKNLINLFRAQGIQLSTKIICPIIGNLDIYSRLGAIITRIDVKNNNHYNYFYNATPLLSLGSEYKINNSWSSRLEYQFTRKIGSNDVIGQETNNSMLVFGLSYSFDKHKSSKLIDKIFFEKLSNNRFNIKSKIFFKFNDFTLQNHSKEILNQIAHRIKLINYHINLTKVAGFADFIGRKKYNFSLSNKRANMVSKYLISQGVLKDILFIESLGSVRSEDNINCKQLKNYKLLKKCLESDRVVEIDISGYYHNLLEFLY